MAPDYIETIIARNRKVVTIFEEASRSIGHDINRFTIRHPPSKYKGNFYKWNKPIEKNINNALSQLRNEIKINIQGGMVTNWDLANFKSSEIVQRFTKGLKLPTAVTTSFRQLNLSAMHSFIDRTEAGMNLSNRVWNLSNNAKSQLELYLSSGVTTGKSAVTLSKEVERFLSGKSVPYQGKLIKAGNISFQAIRLAATEINMSYMTSEFMRWKQLPFVIGLIVELSAAHPKQDICDELVGLYPKGFHFMGWHPLCICIQKPKLMKKEGFVNYIKTGNIPSSLYAKRIPGKAQGYINSNYNSIRKMKNKPYWFRDNFGVGTNLKSSVTEISTLLPDLPKKIKSVKPVKKIIPPVQTGLNSGEVKSISKGMTTGEISGLNKYSREIVDNFKTFTEDAYGCTSRREAYKSGVKNIKKGKELTKLEQIAIDMNKVALTEQNGSNLYRGMSFGSELEYKEFLSKTRIGNTFELKSFTSFSKVKTISEDFAMMYNEGIIFDVVNPQAVKGIFVDNIGGFGVQSEVVVGAGQKFKILKRVEEVIKFTDEVTKIMHYKIELVP